MTVQTIYIARHGYRSNWLPEGPYPSPPTGIDSDVPLAEHGVHQAKELAHYLLSIDNQPELIFSSPFYRCVQTSKPIAGLLEVPVLVERGIGEWYKPDRPVIPVPATIDVLNNFFKPMINEEWESCLIPSDKGETEADIFDRCKRFWPLFIAKVEKEFPNVETILLVTHAASKIALGLNLLGLKTCRDFIDDEGNTIRCGSCSLDKYELIKPKKNSDNNESDEEDAEDIPFEKRKWVLTMNGNTEFLRGGEEMDWNFQRNVEAGSNADVVARSSGNNASNSTETETEIETETIYVSVDLPSKSYKKKTELPRTAMFQYSGLETEAPLFKIGDKVYEGNWQKFLGTEIAFPDAATLNKKTAYISTDTATPTEDRHNEEKEYEENEDEDEERKVDSNKTELENAEKIYRITDRIGLVNLRPI